MGYCVYMPIIIPVFLTLKVVEGLRTLLRDVMIADTIASFWVIGLSLLKGTLI